MRRPLVITACLGLIAASAFFGLRATADDMSSKHMMMGDHGGVQWLIGSWNCTSKMNAMGKMPARTQTSMWNFKHSDQGHWIDFTSTTNGKVDLRAMMYGKNFVGLDSEGGEMMAMSSGMVGNQAIYMGSMMEHGQSMKTRNTVVKVDDTHFRHVS